jgi:hypothetical protein
MQRIKGSPKTFMQEKVEKRRGMMQHHLLNKIGRNKKG